jgi:HlyD family secretion protein
MTAKRIIWAIALAAVVAGVVGLVRYRAANKKPDLPFETAKADKGRIVAKVTATGTLSALVTVQVGSQVSGRLQEIHVDYNSEVKKGQLLAKLDPQLFQAALEQARANYLAAQSNLTKAKVQAIDAERQYKRAKELAERKLTAQADLDTAQATAEAAKASAEAAAGALAQARAALHQADVNLAYATIVSPIDGIVISRNVDVGQTVAASFQAPTLFVIAEDLRKMQVDTSVSEADVGKLKPQMAATFVVDAYPGERFSGKVRQIRNSPQTVQNIVTYDAVIDVDNPDLKLKPGMTANVNFVYADKDDVVRIPNSALRFRPTPELMATLRADGSEGPKRGPRAADAPIGGGSRDPEPRSEGAKSRTVWALRGDRPVQVPIATGVSDGTVTELVEGDVKPGDSLITDSATKSSMPPRPPGRLF